MCGIIGYKGSMDATSIVLNGLKRLEYRGYDSWGVASDNEKLGVARKVGKIGDFKGGIAASRLAIGHTRWATHGSVTEANAHPHTCCSGKIAVVHNGIIENYAELRRELEGKGHVFKSQTDSEVIPHLIEEYCREHEFVEAARIALQRLEGSYAILAIKEGLPAMVGARNGSPLVIGIKGEECFMASDAPAFLEHTNKAIFMDDGEMAVAGESIKVMGISTGIETKKAAATIARDDAQAQKEPYPHFMLKEIMEQKESLMRAISQDEKLLSKAASAINRSKSILFVACGTAYHASLIGTYILGEIAKKKANAVLGSEFSSVSGFAGKGTLVIAVSQSGETADVIGPVREAKARGAKVLAVLNARASSLERLADISIPINAGPEIAVASTKAFTSQAAVLALLAFAAAGKAEEGRNMLAVAAAKLRLDTEKVKAVAEKLDSKDIFTIGRGMNYPVALESALKLKEVSCIHAEGFAAGELKHGTLALIENGTPCIAFFSDDEHKKDTLSNASEVKARGGFLIGVGPECSSMFDLFIEVPKDGIASPIFNAIPAQLLAYYLGVKRGCDIDHCRNLAKSVTVK